MAPQVGLEPTTLRLTAGCSAIELLRSGGTLRACWLSRKIISDVTTIGNTTHARASGRIRRRESVPRAFSNKPKGLHATRSPCGIRSGAGGQNSRLAQRTFPSIEMCPWGFLPKSNDHRCHRISAVLSRKTMVADSERPRSPKAADPVERVFPSPSSANLGLGSSSTTRVRCLCWEVRVCCCFSSFFL
jgi:hypothetical protein